MAATLEPVTRIEHFLDGIINGNEVPYEAKTRVEIYLSSVKEGEVCMLAPVNRVEIYLAKISGQNIDIPEPLTRVELFLAKAAGLDIALPEPKYRLEFWLKELSEAIGGRTVTKSGYVPLRLANTSPEPLASLLVYGYMSQSGASIWINNGYLDKSDGKVIVVPKQTPQTITLNGETAIVENLLAVGNVKDTHDVITGEVIHRNEACVYDGTQSIGSRFVSSTGGKDSGAIIVYPKEKEYSGSVVTFTADEVKQLNGLEVDIDTRVFNEYGEPWKPGDGVNKLAIISNYDATEEEITYYGVKIRHDAYGRFTFSGTCTAGAGAWASRAFAYCKGFALNGRYLHIQVSGSGNSPFIDAKRSGTSTYLEAFNYYNESHVFDLSELASKVDEDERVDFTFSFRGGLSYDGSIVISPMIASSSEPIPFSPYANVCQFVGKQQITAYKAKQYELKASKPISVYLSKPVYGGVLDFTDDGMLPLKLCDLEEYCQGYNSITEDGKVVGHRYAIGHYDTNDYERLQEKLPEEGTYILDNNIPIHVFWEVSQTDYGDFYTVYADVYYSDVPYGYADGDHGNDGYIQKRKFLYRPYFKVHQLYDKQTIDTFKGTNYFWSEDGEVTAFVPEELVVEHVTPQSLTPQYGSDTIDHNFAGSYLSATYYTLGGDASSDIVDIGIVDSMVLKS